MKRSKLDKKIIIITGAAGLIGRAFCKEAAGNGGKVVLVDIDEEKGKNLKDEINNKFGKDASVFFKADITKEDSVKSLVDFTLSEYGRIDGLVNNAYPKGKNFGRKFEDVSYKDFCENVNRHLGGYFLTTQQIAKVMMKQHYGNIVNMGSIYGFSSPRFSIYEGTNMTVMPEYAASKAAIINLTRYLASYLAKYNIRVNSISPGGVFDNQPESFVKRYSQKAFLGNRMAEVGDLTGLLTFLLSNASGYITGQNIIVDGGWSLH